VDIREYNETAWDRQVESNCQWTVPVSDQQIEAARAGKLEIVLTPKQIVPADWFPELDGCPTLCLACGGGQQTPLLAAAGAQVTVLDNSRRQLEQDLDVARRHGLTIEAVQGDMRDLSRFADESFEFVFHPCSVSFIPDVEPVWNEVFRVLKPGGTYLLGACHPLVYLLDYEQLQQGQLVVAHSIPYSDLESLNEQQRQALIDQGEPLCFGHSLEDLIGGQLQAGFELIGFYEDDWGQGPEQILDQYIKSLFATRARKPG
jgi:SAM-dependent methyltransferase